jgi:hypothetical protein
LYRYVTYYKTDVCKESFNKLAIFYIFSTIILKVLILRSGLFFLRKPMQLQLEYPKPSILRLENLLMLVPLVAYVSIMLFSNTADLDSRYQETYFTFKFQNVVVFNWILLILPFLFHLFLNQESIGDSRIMHGHIIISLCLLIAVLFTYQLSTPNFIVNQDTFQGLPTQRHWLEATAATFQLLILQGFVQLFFMVYCLVKLFP